MKMKIDYKLLVDNYYRFYLSQKEIFGLINEQCPYYSINIQTLKKLPQEYQKKLNDIQKAPEQIMGRNIWEQILRDLPSELKPKNKAKKNIKIKFSYQKKSSFSLLSSQEFLVRCKENGLVFDKVQFKWLEENQLILPMGKKGTENYYSIFQLSILDFVQECKNDCLDYPNSKYKYSQGRKVRCFTWQESLLSNKEAIIKENKEWLELIIVLINISHLYKITKEEAIRQIQAVKKKKEDAGEKIKGLESLVSDIFCHLRDSIGGKLARKIFIHHKKINEAVINYWIESYLSALAIKHNPILQLADEIPTLPSIIRDNEHRISTIFRKNDDIKIANYYLMLIDYLKFYLRCLAGKKMLTDEEILSKYPEEKSRICIICKKKFNINPLRRGGKAEKICGDRVCQLKYKRILAKKDYNKKHLGKLKV